MGDTESGRGRTVMARRPREIEPEKREVERSEKIDYHVFPDSAIIDEWTFRGDGRDTVKWFNDNSNYDSLIKSMNDDDHNAFSSWMSGHFMSGQMYRGFDRMNNTDQRMVRSYDKILDQSVINEAFTVRRLATAELVLGAGNRTPTSPGQLKALIGKTITSKGNMSTAAASRGLAIGSTSRKPVEYVMKFPAGVRGAGMWIGDRRIGGWGSKQREFMTNRDIKFTIGDVKYNRGTGKYEVELIYAGRNEHDYGSRGR